MKNMVYKSTEKVKNFCRWIFFEFRNDPLLELYAKSLNRKNLKLNNALTNGGNKAFSEFTRSYVGKDVPKIIWIFWAQGEEKAPFLVRTCIKSWKINNKDWDVRIIDRDSIKNYVDIPHISDNLPFRFSANILRLKLLEKFGGVWADATTYCHKPLSEWMPILGGQSGFFTFRGPYFDRWIDNWFIAACPQHPLIKAWASDYENFITRCNRTPSTYFMMIYILQWRVLRDRTLRHLLIASGGLPAVPAFFLQGYLDNLCHIDQVQDMLNSGYPVSKLNWRLDISVEELRPKLESLNLK